MRIRHADLRVRSAAELAPEHERDDARQVGLVREHLQVEHQPARAPRRMSGMPGRLVDATAVPRRSASSAFWMRRSTSRSASRYSTSFARSLGPSAVRRSATSSRNANRACCGRSDARARRAGFGRPRCRRTAARRRRADCSPSAAASRSRATRSCWCRRSANPTSHAPGASRPIRPRARATPAACARSSAATIWSIEMPASSHVSLRRRRDVGQEPRARFRMRAARASRRRARRRDCCSTQQVVCRNGFERRSASA